MFKFPKAPYIARHIRSMCALLHKLSDDMHLYLDSIKKKNELCEVISDTGQSSFAKRDRSWGQPSLAGGHHPLAPNQFSKEVQLWTPCHMPSI